MKKQFGDYFLGFDIGTDSIGWAVTNENYELLKFNGKAMWGIHLFESGKTAEERRMARSSRRRTMRNKARLELLRELFAKEINNVDPIFFERLDESKFWIEDRTTKQTNTLFNDINYKDKDFYREFPTIYHLRSRLIHNSEKADVRLVYLALHHIIKHRGHFLFEGQDFNTATSFDVIFEELLNTLSDYGIEFTCTNYSAIEELLKDKHKGVKDRKRILAEILNADDKVKKAVCDLMAGGTVKLSDLFEDESLDDSEMPKISFSDGIDEKIDILRDILDERLFIVEKIKAVYDWAILVDILKNNEFISDAKKDIFDEHSRDLKLLKELIKTYVPEKYDEVFKDNKQKINYCTYVGKVSKKGKVLDNSICLQEDFCKYLRTIIPRDKVNDSEFEDILFKINNNILLPKQVSKNNSVIPYQLNLKELERILDNASSYLPFLLEKDEKGLSVKDKVRSIFTFRIPYYVGPLNSTSENSWIVRKEEGKIYPWNFEEKVDLEASATEFIERMTNMCTYLIGKKVMPKDSILYSKYMIYNQLNNIKIDGEKLPVDIKNRLFRDKFLNEKRTTNLKSKSILEYLRTQGLIEDIKDIQLTGIDGEIKGTMKAYNDFKEILGDNFDEVLADEIIKKIVILGDDKKMLKNNLKLDYGSKLTDEQIKQIAKKKYTGWGRFSREFLTEVYHTDKATGECISIMTALENTNDNLMQLLSNDYDFKNKIDEKNAYANGRTEDISYKDIEDLYVSPAVKRSIWRTVVLAKEIKKVTGHVPKKIFIEMARGEEEKKLDKKNDRKPRKQRLLELYKNCRAEAKDLIDDLENTVDSNLNGDKLFLYYTQMGRCMYSGERIDIEELATKYDIDHIFPQSKVKDDSLENRVLVKKELNAKKSDTYPIPDECVTNSARFLWKALREKKFITEEKYNRLTRRNGFSENELSGFIARQLVETRQSTKAVADILKKMFEDSTIVYVKAGNVSRFRQDNEFIKCRAVNDYHHAKDAYLNIVVGNVYDTKFTSNPVTFIKSGAKYSLNKVFDFDVERNGKVAWNKERSLEQVKKVMARNNILFTRYATEAKGALFDLLPMKKGNGQLPLKSSDSRLRDIEKYGGYNKVGGAYFILIEHEVKGKKVKTIEFVPIYLAKEIEKDSGKLTQYCNCNWVNPRIIIPKIKINTLFCVDGFYMHLSGRTGNRLILKCANQLVLNDENVKYLKKVTGYIEKCKERKTKLEINEHTKITAEENIKIYDELLNKLKTSVYSKKLEPAILNLENGKEKFISLELNEQCEVICEILKLSQCTSASADFKLISGPANTGMLYLSKDISKQKNIYIINQSPTGLFEERKNLADL